jgi:hypothetical protein
MRKGVVDSPTNTEIGIRLQGTTVEVQRTTEVTDKNIIQVPGYRKFAKATVNGNGPFFNPRSTTTIGRYRPTSRESKVLQILHELAHMVLNSDGDPLILDDGANKNLSSSNTEKILEHCKKEIDEMGDD